MMGRRSARMNRGEQVETGGKLKRTHYRDTVNRFNHEGAVVAFSLPEVHYHRRREVERNMATPMHRIIARRQA